MIENIKVHNPGVLLLRIGFVLVYLYFGLSQLSDPETWSGAVPSWATLSIFSTVTMVYVNAIFEIIFAILLALNVWSKWVSIILGIHLGIITLVMGYTPTGVRDFGLTLATFAHGFLGEEK